MHTSRAFLIMNNRIQISITSADENEQEILLALLSGEHYDGFEQTDTSLDAFIDEELFDETRLNAILNPFAKTYKKTTIAPQNWNAAWEKNYEPVVVEDFVTVRAHFHAPAQNTQYEIIITPKMSFGTGHHATTWQMMKLMQGIDFKNKNVFDFGCGTGVLAILAEKLAATAVLAIDYDDWCIENSIENVQNNHCSNIAVEKGDVPPAGKSFDIILANINRHDLLQHMQSLSNALVNGGYLFISGFYSNENKLMSDAAGRYGLQLKAGAERHEWSSLIFQKQLA